MVNQVCIDVKGNCSKIEDASQAGQFELNIMMPIINFNSSGSQAVWTTGKPAVAQKTLLQRDEGGNYDVHGDQFFTKLSEKALQLQLNRDDIVQLLNASTWYLTEYSPLLCGYKAKLDANAKIQYGQFANDFNRVLRKLEPNTKIDF